MHSIQHSHRKNTCQNWGKNRLSSNSIGAKDLAAMQLDDSPSVNVESKAPRVAGFDGECGRVQDIEDSERDVSTVSDGILQQQKTSLQYNQGWKLTPTTGQKKVTFPSGPLVSKGFLPYFIYTVIFHLPFWQ